MKRGTSFRTLLASIFKSLALLASALAATPQRPKVVFIVLDNVGQEWFGC